MALVEKSPIIYRGKLGNNIFRLINGRIFVSSAPKTYTISNSEAAVESREKFRFIVRFAKAITSNYSLNYLWKELKLPGIKSLTKIMKYFYHEIKDYNLSTVNLLPSNNQFQVTLNNLSRNGKEIDILLNPLPENAGISELITPVISSQGFIFLNKPTSKRKEPFQFIPVASPDISTALGSDLSFSFKISSLEAKQINSYTVKNILFNLVLKEPTGKPVRSSNTIFLSL